MQLNTLTCLLTSEGSCEVMLRFHLQLFGSTSLPVEAAGADVSMDRDGFPPHHEFQLIIILSQLLAPSVQDQEFMT